MKCKLLKHEAGHFASKKLQRARGGRNGRTARRHLEQSRQRDGEKRRKKAETFIAEIDVEKKAEVRKTPQQETMEN